MKLLLLSLLVACGPKKGETPEPPPTDGPAGMNTPTKPSAGPVVPVQKPKPGFLPSEPPGQPGSDVDAERLEHLRGAWRDEGGAIVRVESGAGVLIDGKPVAWMVRWCVDGATPKLCMQVKQAPATPGGSAYLVLVQQDDDTLVQSEVGEGYVVRGPVAGGQVFTRLGEAPTGAALPRDQRVQLGADGEPLFCASGGVISTQCDGHYRVTPLMPLFGKVVEEETISLVGHGAPKGCNPGIRVDEAAGATLRNDLGRVVTPVEPREDHLRRIGAAVGVAAPKVSQAAWVDLDGDRREELVFELHDVPADQPAYSAVGLLRGGTLDVQLLEVRRGATGAAPLRLHLLGLVDLMGDGQLSLLTDVGGLDWVLWGLDPANGLPKSLGRGVCM